MPNIWVGGDWHLWNVNLRDERHPFRSKQNIEEFKQYLASKPIQPDDVFLVLGDLCDPEVTDTQNLRDVIAAIPPCIKVLVKGNHDTAEDSLYLNAGFDLVTDIVLIHHMVFSHIPVYVSHEQLNVHAHLHSVKISVFDERYVNVKNVDPCILLDDLLDRAMRQNKSEYEGVDNDRAIQNYFKNNVFMQQEDAGEMRILDLSYLVPQYPVDEAAVLNEYIFDCPDEARMWLADDDTPPKADEGPAGEEKDNHKYTQTNYNTMQESTSNGLRAEAEESVNLNDGQSSKAVVLTFYLGNNKVGTASVSGYDTGAGFLYDLEVVKRYRGKGYSKDILEYVMKNYSVTDISVEDSNKVAINLYEKFGFKLKKVFDSNGENGYDKGRYRWYQLDESVGDSDADYLDHPEERRIMDLSHLVPEYPMDESVLNEYIFNNPDETRMWLADDDTPPKPDTAPEGEEKDNRKYVQTNLNTFQEAAVVGPAVSTPEDLSKWMKRNIRYGNYHKLMTPAEVMDTGSGSCHDQVAFEYPILKRMKVHPRILFFIAINEDRGTSGQTHSLIWWKDDRGKVYWFENSWGGNQGIHTFNSIAEMKAEIRKRYAENPDAKKNPQLVFQDTTIRNFKPGISLGDLVDAVYNGKKLDESVDDSEAEYLEHPEVKDDTFNGEQIKFFQDQQTYKESLPDESAEVGDIPDYKFSLEEEIVFNDDDLLDEAVSENSKLYPVYVVLIHSGTLVSNAIKKVSKAEFSHASISFDSTLKRMYSFARKDPKNPFAGGFRYESIGEGFYTKEKMDKTPFAIYLVPCTKYQIEKMKKRLKYFIENESKFTFDFVGLFKNYFGIVANPKMKWFCSRFVADILNAGANNKKKFIKEPSLMDPEDFKKTDFARFVCGGMLGSYNQKETDQITKGILKSEVLLRKQGKRFTYHTFGEAATYSDKIQWYKNAIRNESVEEYERSTKELRICFTPDMRMKLDKENYEVFYAVYRHLLTSFVDCGEYDVETRMELYGKLQSLVKFFQQYFFPSVTDPATNEFAAVYTRLHAEMLRGLSVCRKKLDTTVIPESVTYFQSGRTIPYLTETVYVVPY